MERLGNYFSSLKTSFLLSETLHHGDRNILQSNFKGGEVGMTHVIRGSRWQSIALFLSSNDHLSSVVAREQRGKFLESGSRVLVHRKAGSIS